jgi:hypothetical protein
MLSVALALAVLLLFLFWFDRSWRLLGPIPRGPFLGGMASGAHERKHQQSTEHP